VFVPVLEIRHHHGEVIAPATNLFGYAGEDLWLSVIR
jgi:hypothetical protein